MCSEYAPRVLKGNFTALTRLVHNTAASVVASAAREAAATRAECATGARSLRARREQVLAEYVGAPDGVALVDVRSPAEFSGETTAPPHLPLEAAMVPGHIPGATNVPWATAVNPDTGEFKSIEQLKEVYEGKGLDGNDEIVAYCRIGERSAHSWFVLHELLGYDRVRNYDGSWTEYGSLVDVPVEKG